MINGDNEGLMVQENVRIPVAVKSPYHAQFEIAILFPLLSR